MKIRTLLLLLALAATAFANTLTLHNTGANASGGLLAPGAVDSYYLLVSGPANGVVTAVNYEAATWVGNNATSQWITPNSGTYAIGTYDYQTAFSLGNLDPNTAVISGFFSSDNGSNIVLNGISTGITVSNCQYTCWTPFTINAGFVSGLNTLDFMVTNDGGPTGLRVDMSGTASPVPEPATLWLLAGGLLALCGVSLRRRRAASTEVGGSSV